ncbi:Flp pilus assembly protein CpaB [Dongia deserti]|uniref:Flp pilus assembly protein CpaB n=1 Tax=Dongia deserti TaxID=2268030 RepID=UPI000E64B94C|nr:Flp pilus assembly protein CpaB [Dongia deserti]
MRPSVIMLAVVALVLAGAAAFLVKVFLERQAQPVIVQEEKPKGGAKVLVASRTINPGEILSTKDVTWAEWPKALITERMIDESEFVVPSATVPPTQVGMIVRTGEGDASTKKSASGAVENGAQSSSPADAAIVGAVARRRILANEPISPDQLIQRGDRSIGSAVVSPGMRAVSIPINATSASGGFIAPGDYVDVILSIEHKLTIVDGSGKELPQGTPATLPDGDELLKVTSETVLRNVKVLAIDQKLGRRAEEGPADVGKTATLEVSLSDTEKLLTASKLGSLTLVLRSMIVEDTPQDEIDAFEDPFNFTTDVATSRAVSAIHTTSSLYGHRESGGVRVNRGGAISQEGK